jgi:hypothetical protein
MRGVSLVIGTRKGLFVARSEDRAAWTLEGPHIAGYEIQSAWLDPRDPRTGYAAAHHPVWGVHVYRSDDAGASWQPLTEVPRHRADEGPESLKTLWCLAPGPADAPATVFAGIEPPGLFVSPDAGRSWTPLPGLAEHPTASQWHPAKGGLALHSIQPDATTPGRLYAALCAGGCYRSDDNGETFRRCRRSGSTRPRTGLHRAGPALSRPAGWSAARGRPWPGAIAMRSGARRGPAAASSSGPRRG